MTNWRDLVKNLEGKTRLRTVIANAGAPLPMAAAKAAWDQSLITPVLVGDLGAITAEAEKLEWDISTFDIHHAASEDEAGHKAAALCHLINADLLMKGHIHTDVFMKTALAREHQLRTGKRLVHLFIHFMADRILAVSDAAVNVSPDLQARKDATRLMLEVLKLLKLDPTIAYLSATESPVASVPSAVDAAELVAWARSTLDHGEYAGPVALDWILSHTARKAKGLDQDVMAGRVNGIIVPDIITGNTLSKALVYLAQSVPAGIVLGGKIPFLLNSRADSVEARLASLAMARLWLDARVD